MSVDGKGFCFLGKFARDMAPVHDRVKRLGGTVITNVKDEGIHYVVLGTRAAKSKERSARKRKLSVLSLAELVTMLDAAEAPKEPPPTPPPCGPNSPHALMVALDELDANVPDGVSTLIASAGPRVVLDLDRTPLDGSHAASTDANEPPPWLLAWCSDVDGCTFYVIPAADLTPITTADLLAVRGLCFANGNETTPEILAAAVRLLAGMGPAMRGDDAAKARALFDGWSMEFEALDPPPIASAADLEPLIGWLEPHFVNRSAALRRRFAQIIAVNQAT